MDDGTASKEVIEAEPLMLETARREYCTTLPDHAEGEAVNLRISLDVVCRRLGWVDGSVVA